MNNNCNCNDKHKNAIKKIEDANKNVTYRYIQGPKGDRGEQGPTTIKIGKIETVESTEVASITNSGTKSDLILDFKIPKGEKGDQGSQGPKGDKGDPYLKGYAMRYSSQNNPLELTKMADTVVPLNEKTNSYNIGYDTENSLDIKENGIYQISYYLSASTNTKTPLTISIMNGNNLVLGSNIKTKWEANELNNIQNTIITELKKGDSINLNIRGEENVTVTFSEETNALLTISKIG